MAEDQAATQQQGERQFALQKIYSKDLSFEAPGTPGVFRKTWQPEVSVDLNTKHSAIDAEGNYEVVLAMTVTAQVEGETAFLIEVHQAGIFLARGIEGEELRRLLGTAAPNILFPYVRETIDSVCLKGSFPPLMLAPVNFDAVYQRAQEQSQGATAAN